jgi:hypothetical protein
MRGAVVERRPDRAGVHVLWRHTCDWAWAHGLVPPLAESLETHQPEFKLAIDKLEKSF